MAASPTSTVNSSGVDKNINKPYDPSGDLAGLILGAINGGLDTPGTPGTYVGGGLVSQAGLRGQLQQSAAQAEADRQNVYNQVNQAILGRAQGIQDTFNQAGQALETDAANRTQADQSYALQRQNNAARAASDYGLAFVPDGGGAADQQMLNNQRTYQAIADSWKGFDQASGQSALERNNMVADAFTHEGLQQQAALQQQLAAALSKAQDYYTAGRYVGGSKGSSLSPASKLAAAEYMLNYGSKQQAAAAANTPKTSVSTSTKKVGGKTVSSTTTKKTSK